MNSKLNKFVSMMCLLIVRYFLILREMKLLKLEWNLFKKPMKKERRLLKEEIKLIQFML